MIETNPTTGKSYRYWQKFAVVLLVGIALLLVGNWKNNEYVTWSAAIVLVFSGWYGILSVFQFFDKIDRR